MNVFFRISLIIGMFLLMAGCGGGGSSSSGGGESVAGTYVGTASMTVTSVGFRETVNGSLEFRIDADGTVTSDSGEEFSGTGKVIGSRVVLDVGARVFNEPGFSCLGSFRFEGTIRGARIEGTINSSSIACNGVPITVTGTFQLNRVAQARGALGGGIMGEVGPALRAVLP